MPQLKKLLILFAVLIIATTLSPPSSIHASPHKDDDLSLSPEPQQPAFDQEQHMAPLGNAENPSSLSPLPFISLDIEAPYSSEDNEEEDGLYYSSPSEAPTPSPISPSPEGFVFSGEPDNDNTPYDDGDEDDAVPTQANVLPFNYSAEDDAGEFTNENYYYEGYHVEKKQVAVVGFVVVGAVCLVGLGGFVWNIRKNQKRKQYQNLYYKRDEA